MSDEARMLQEIQGAGKRPMGDASYALHAHIADLESQLASLTEENERAEDFRAEIAIEAVTAPDADWGTILDSLRSRIRDLNLRAYTEPGDLLKELAFELARADRLAEKVEDYSDMEGQVIDLRHKLSEAEQREQVVRREMAAQAFTTARTALVKSADARQEAEQRAVRLASIYEPISTVLRWAMDDSTDRTGLAIDPSAAYRLLVDVMTQSPNPESETDG